MLECKHISCGYGRKSAPVVRDLSARFAPGRLTALIGPNGCGKSTLIKAIMGFLPLQSGEISLQRQALAGLPRRKLAQLLAYLPQENHCPDYLTLGELVELGGFARQGLLRGPSDADRARFAEALAHVGLADRADAPVNRLSGGQRQRAWIAMILAQDAETILLDEPVNHLDVKYQISIMTLIRSLIREQGKTVIAVLHDLNLAARFADDVLVMRGGEMLAAGAVRDVITPQIIEKAYDFKADIFEHSGRLICLPQEDGRAA